MGVQRDVESLIPVQTADMEIERGYLAPSSDSKED